MKNKSAIFFLFVCAFLNINCNGQTHESKTQFANLKPLEFDEQMKSQPGVILDVRTKEEFDEGHIAKTILIDYYDKDFKTQLLKLDSTQTIYVYCRSGSRSAKAATILCEAGFKNVVNMKGGIEQWETSNLPVEK